MKKLYYNGTVLTMDTPLYAEAVCTENGRICGVGKMCIRDSGWADLFGQCACAQPRVDCGGVKRMEGFEFKTENRIVVGMSGGVDSSVAAPVSYTHLGTCTWMGRGIRGSS